MQTERQPILVRVLAHPELLGGLSLQEWDLLIRQARRTDLLARLWHIIQNAGVEGSLAAVGVPEWHFRSADKVAAKQAHVVAYEVRQIDRALREIGQPLVLLKGAAYVVAGLPAATGRVFADIDILVPKERLAAVEAVMLKHGWETTHLDAYDQKYYRAWMHELPPMRHVRRNTVIDIHHAILPETARLHPDPVKMMANVQPLPGLDNIYTLADVDMVLHSATHLFHEGEFERGLRDLVDMDALLNHFSGRELFWDHLIERAVELGLERPLFYALHYCRLFLQTPMPEVAVKAASALGAPALPLRLFMEALFNRALLPHHPSCDDRFTPLARWMLYIRSHYLRMPFHLLLPHLIRKAIKNHQSSAPLNGQQIEKN